MSAHLIAGRKLAAGLTWLVPGTLPTTSSEARKAREFQTIKPAPLGYAELETPAGTQTGATLDPTDIGLESSAAWLALAQSSAVLIEKLDSDQYWLCAVEDGAVFPAGDIIGDKDLIASRLDEIRLDIEGTNIRLYEKTGLFALGDCEPLDLSDLIADIEPQGDISCRLIHTRNLRKPLLTSITAVLIAIGGYGAWNYYQKLTGDSSETDQIRLAARQAQLVETEKMLLKQSLSQNASALLATLADTVYSRPLRAAGWYTGSYEWSKDSVTATWQRAHGSIADISEHLESRDHHLDEESGTVIERFDFPAHEISELPPIEEYLGGQHQRHQLLDILARLPGKWTLSPPQSSDKGYLVQRSELRGSSERLQDVITVAHALSKLPVHITRLKFQLGNSYEWKMEGDYYGKHE